MIAVTAFSFSQFTLTSELPRLTGWPSWTCAQLANPDRVRLKPRTLRLGAINQSFCSQKSLFLIGASPAVSNRDKSRWRPGHRGSAGRLDFGIRRRRRLRRSVRAGTPRRRDTDFKLPMQCMRATYNYYIQKTYM